MSLISSNIQNPPLPAPWPPSCASGRYSSSCPSSCSRARSIAVEIFTGTPGRSAAACRIWSETVGIGALQ